MIFTLQHKNGSLSKKTIKLFVLELNTWCDMHKTRIFHISERGVPENPHVYWNSMKYSNGGFIPEHAGLQFFKTKLKHLYTYIQWQKDEQTILQNTKQLQKGF